VIIGYSNLSTSIGLTAMVGAFILQSSSKSAPGPELKLLPLSQRGVKSKIHSYRATAMRILISLLCFSASVSALLLAPSQQPDWKAFDDETKRHFQTLVRFDTMDLVTCKNTILSSKRINGDNLLFEALAKPNIRSLKIRTLTDRRDYL
jgi:hypothetical protein